MNKLKRKVPAFLNGTFNPLNAYIAYKKGISQLAELQHPFIKQIDEMNQKFL